MKAYWRDDLEEIGELPACSEDLSFEEWHTLYFKVLDQKEEFETGEDFNMSIIHPLNGKILLVESIDFNFSHYFITDEKIIFRKNK